MEETGTVNINGGNSDAGDKSFMEKVFNLFSTTHQVAAVFGEPIDQGGKQVIPVAKVRITGGGGGGLHGKDNADQGGGGGGYASVKPLGVFEIDDQQTVFKPAVDLNFLTLMVTLVTFGLFLLLKTKKTEISKRPDEHVLFPVFFAGDSTVV